MRISGSGFVHPFLGTSAVEGAPEGEAQVLLEQLLARVGPELFDGSALTGQAATPLRLVQGGGTPILQSELASRMGVDRRAQTHLARQTAETQATQALFDGPFDRAKVESAIKEQFAKLAKQGLSLEGRPGSVMAEALADGDFSQLDDQQLMDVLIMMALFGQNRHKPGAVASQSNAPLAPRGSWSPGGGANRAGGGTAQTGANRPATVPSGPTPPAGEIPPGTPMGQRLAISARNVANDMNSTGWCFRGVGRAVAQATGVQLSGASAYMAADQLAASDKFREIQVSPDQLRDLPAGAVVVWDKTSASPHGHISVALGNGQEASDHVQSQITSLRGSNDYRVFVPNG